MRMLLSWMFCSLVVLGLGPGGVSGQLSPGSTPATPCGNDWWCGTAINSTLPECIPIGWRCDGDKDCTSSGSDEELCDSLTSAACKANETACITEGCIPNRFVCDRVQDCPEDEDEQNCTYEACPPNMFTCINERHCVPPEGKCNGIIDCGDGSDEADELCNPPPCPPNQFMCKTKKCIDNSMVCSGSDECGDNSDEDGCGIDECKNKTLNACSDFCHNINIKYFCTCNVGYELKADNHTCQDTDECKLTPLKCSQFCDNAPGNYSCSCADGYSLKENGACRKTDDIEPLLIFANRYQLRIMTLNGTTLGRANEENKYVHVLDYDYENSYLYFADAGAGEIKRMLFNGSDEVVLISQGLPFVEGIAFDWVNKKIYWTDSQLPGIFVAQANGTQVKILQKERTKLPRAIVLYPGLGYLYWTDWQFDAFIGRMEMDGRNMVKLITKGLFWPNALTIDYVTQRLWWADAHLDRIETAKLDGTGRYAVYENLPHIYSLNIFEDYMYWSDWNLKTIERANRFNGEGRVQLAKLNHQPFDLHIMHPLRQNMSTVNPCQPDNGGCSHLCLLAHGSSLDHPSFSCACPYMFSLMSDNKTCEADCDPRILFICNRTDHKCISNRWVCDGEKDCKGGEDEDNCPDPLPCSTGYAPCATGDQCVRDPADICDGIEDCADKSDEDSDKCAARICLPTEFRCATGQCIALSRKCNGDSDCKDGDDEGDHCEALRPCTEDEFSCDNGKCIPKLWKCDYDDDCGDRSDEPRDQCHGQCREGWTKCTGNYRCVPELMLCDGRDDCRDNSDEDESRCAKDCGNGEFKCDDGDCIPLRWRCDFDNDCEDASDENVTQCMKIYPPCEENEFRCDNEKCIREHYKCDTDDDCDDGSDERDCSTHKCVDDDFWQCTSGHCILKLFRCDGTKHCMDLSDEAQCPTRYPGGRYCDEDEFQCKSTVCISPSWVCDAEDDCGDRSDEEPALCASRPCDSDERFRCDNNYCIRRIALCDKVNDCGDASDENNFTICTPPTTRCSLGEFKCTNGKCISETLVCNDQNDCGDGSEEHGCHPVGSGTCGTNNGGCQRNCTTYDNRYFCSCGEGRRIDPANKKLCIDFDECDAFRNNFCDQGCYNTDGSFKCYCESGFDKVDHATGFVCKPNQGETETVLIAMENSIRQYRVSMRLYTDVITSRSEVRALDVDGKNNMVYWTDAIRNTVFRTWVPESPSQVSLPQDLNIYSMDIIPEGIAYDWASDNIYISDSKSGRIIVSKSDGRYATTIVKASTRRPFRLALSPKLGLLFWADTRNRKIESAWMDGTNIKTVVTVDVSDITSVVVDHYMNSRLYWADTKRNRIESCKFDGTDRVSVTDMDMNHPFSIDVFETQMFWVSQVNRSLYEMDKFGRGINVTHVIQSNLLRPMDVKVLHPQKQPQGVNISRCANMTCYPLCVLVPSGGKCLCPDGTSFTSPGKCNTAYVPPLSLPKPCVCKNGGTCALQPDLRNVYCLCKPGFEGFECEKQTTVEPPSTIPMSPKPTRLPPLVTTPTPKPPTTTEELKPTKSQQQGSEELKPTKSQQQGSEGLVAVIVPIVVVVILLVIIILVLLILYRRGIIGASKSGHGVFRPGAPGTLENGAGENHYEDPMSVRYDTSTNGISNPIYDVTQPTPGGGDPNYAALSDVNGLPPKKDDFA